MVNANIKIAFTPKSPREAYDTQLTIIQIPIIRLTISEFVLPFRYEADITPSRTPREIA